MGEDNRIWYTLSESNYGNYTISTDGIMYNNATISTNYGTTFNNVDEKINKLENEVKDLKKRMSRLTTLILTHIGEEQLEKFNDENK